MTEKGRRREEEGKGRRRGGILLCNGLIHTNTHTDTHTHTRTHTHTHTHTHTDTHFSDISILELRKFFNIF